MCGDLWILKMSCDESDQTITCLYLCMVKEEKPLETLRIA